jgi:hypothetical protein
MMNAAVKEKRHGHGHVRGSFDVKSKGLAYLLRRDAPKDIAHKHRFFI